MTQLIFKKTQIIKTLIGLIIMILVSSCTNPTPEKTIDHIISDLKNNNYQDLTEYMFSDNVELDGKDLLKFEKLFKTIFDASNDIIDYAVIYTDSSKNNDNATTRNINLMVSYSNGKVDNVPMRLKKETTGQWKIILNEDTTSYPLLNGLYLAKTWVLADKGNPLSQYNLAMLFREGKYVKRDTGQYLKLLETSSQKVPKAMYQLAFEYYMGNSMLEKDHKKAFELFIKANENGNDEALPFIANAYLTGDGVTENHEKAFEFAKRGIDKSIPEAFLIMGNIYRTGSGQVQDYKKAYEYYSKGAELGNNNCLLFLGHLYMRGEGTAQNKIKAFECYQKAVNHGYSLAKPALAECYYRGSGVSQNIALAKQMLKECREEGIFDNNLLAEIEQNELVAQRALEYARSLNNQQYYVPRQQNIRRKRTCMLCRGQGVFYTNVFIDTYPGHWETRSHRCTECYGLGYIEE